MGRRLFYVANARLPTEKAHGHAIVKMCEAYALAGVELELWHPRRQQGDPRLASTTVFDYYDVPPVFAVRTLENFDVIPAESWFPKRLFPFLVGAHDLMWGWYAAHRLRGRTPDLCHTRDIAVAFWLVRAGVPTVLEVHDPPNGPGRRLLQLIATRPALRGVIALTEACRQTLASMKVPDAKMIVLGSCVDLAPYEALASRAKCRRAIGVPIDRQVVGYVGKFEALGAEKGLSTLIEAFGKLRHEVEPSPLLVCVGGPMNVVPRLVETARAVGVPKQDLRFVNHVSSAEVPTWIRACDVGVLPSPRSDHLARFSSPLKVFEFMAAGVPMVASDLPAVREIVSHEENAWLVEPEDPAALARGLARLLQDDALRARLGDQATADVSDHTWARRAATVLARFAGGDLALEDRMGA